MLKKWMPKRLPVGWWGVVVALVATVCMTIPALAAGPEGALALPDIGENITIQGPSQVFRDDLTVEGGQTLEGDVLVYTGDVKIEGGGRITGDLVVFSGDLEMDAEAAVDGNVTSYSGDASIEGHISGNLAVMAGDVDLAASARVDGDVSIVSGDIDREAGATVGGNVVQGPSFRFPGNIAPVAPGAPDVPGVSFGDSKPSFFETLLRFIGRLFTAALTTALMMLLVGGLFYLRPQLIADTRKQLNEKLALSAVVGAAVNLVGLFLAGLLAVTICLLPLALIPLLLLFAVNVVGWTVASQIVGERIVTAVKQQVQPSLTILVGALFLTGICALLWAFGGCFRFVGHLLIFAVASVGTGAALLPWINRRRGFGGAGTSGSDVPPTGPQDGGQQPSGPVAGERMPSDVPVDLDAAAPLDYVTAEEINASRGGDVASASTLLGQTPAEAEAAPQDVVEHDVAAPLDYMTAEEINATAEQPPAKPAKPRSRLPKAASSEATETGGAEPVEQDVAAPIDYVTAQEVVTTETISEGDDFLQIKGIGPTYARRLKDAGYATFAQVSAATPEQIAAAIGWPVDRVRRSEVIDQAKVLAQR